MQTFPEHIAEQATWLDRVCCLLFGHRKPRFRRLSLRGFCWCCGKERL